ncbi:MAG: AMP-binding protein [Nitrospirae bacterium]|nr:AMP-binding protein [Nitrospirota bacterium]
MQVSPFTFNELVIQRGTDPESAGRVMVQIGDQTVTYADYLRTSCLWAHMLLAARRDSSKPPQVAALMRNSLDYLYLFGGAAFSGGTLFAINTGLGGDTLARVIEKSGADILVADDTHRPVLEKARANSPDLAAKSLLLAGPGGTIESRFSSLRSSLRSAAEEPPDVPVDASTPWMVIYTSGTTGLPKGILNSHGKLRAIGAYTANLIGLKPDDVGYICMPLFHSNAHYLNWMPAYAVGAKIILREKFSASAYLDDIFNHGATYWNYVGQPVQYILEAIAKKYGDDESRILREVRDHPRRKLRLALGTGASGKQRIKFIRWLGLEHFYEMYGSTEAEIATCCRPGDPIDSVGEVTDENVFIRNGSGATCPPAEFDGSANILNYAEAVGEIVRGGTPTGLFQGYHGDEAATQKKFSDGLYRSGDLGMIRLINGHRYLYFVGRTDDWIRKDGENFSADCVVDLVSGFPDVYLAAAYGVPNPVSDEWVMAAIQLKDGRAFDPQAFFDYCEREVSRNGRDRKWFPDFIRIVNTFPLTETHKIIVRELKAGYFHPERAEVIYFRRRNDATYHPLAREDFEKLRSDFDSNGRLNLLV